MTQLDRYFGRRLLSALAKSVLGLVAMVVIIDLFTHRQDEISRFEVPSSVVAAYYAALTPRILLDFHIAGVSLLVATLLVFGNASQTNEIVAALAGGISLRRLVRVPILIAATLALAMFVFQETLGPVASAHSRRTEDVYFSRSAEDERAGVSWAQLEGGWTCHILKYNRQARTGENVILDKRTPEESEHVDARRIYWDELEESWILEDGVWSTYFPQQQMANRHEHFSQRPAPVTEDPETLFALEAAPDTKSARELALEIERANRRGMRTEMAWLDFHLKFAKPAMSFVMIFIAIPFAIRLRRGGLAVGFGASVAIALAYVLLFEMARGLGHVVWLPAFASAWLANAVFLVIGVILFLKTPT